MTRRERRAKAERSNKVQTIVGGVALAAVASVAFAAVLVNASHAPPPLDANGCPVSQPLAGSTVLVLDMTDAATTRQRAEIADLLRDTARKARQYEKLTLAVLDGKQPYQLSERLSRCSPRPPFPINIITQTPAVVQADWDAAFGQPVEDAIGELAETPPDRESPIVEGVAAVTWRSDFRPDTPRKRLILVSDLMHHRKKGPSLYSGRRVALGPDQPDLRGVDVDLVVLHRGEVSQVQSQVAIPLWCDWLRDRGAASVKVDGAACPAKAEETLS